jgi:hypothetical protein
MPETPLVLVELGGAEGLDDPVITKDDRVTVVSLTWDRPMSPNVVDEAIRVLSQHQGEHPRIDLVLERLKGLP